MFNTILSKLVMLVSLAVATALLIGGVGLWSNSQLESTAHRAEDYGVAIQNEMQADMQHDNTRGLVEKYVSAVRENKPELIAEAAKEIKIATAILKESFLKNGNSEIFSENSRMLHAKALPLVQDYIKTAEAIANMTGFENAEVEQVRANFNSKFRLLEKELGAFNDSLNEDIKETKARATETVTSTYTFLGIATVFGSLILISAAVLTYLSVASSLSRLEETIAKVNAGDTLARVNLTTQDELGALGRSFDALLDERIASLESKNRDNEAINNSAINLLQSVYALSEKNLTARATVSDDIVGTIASSVNQFADETAKTLSEVQSIAGQVSRAAQDAQKQSVVVEGASSRERTLLDSMGATLGSATRQLSEVAQLSSASGAVAVRTAEATQAAQMAVEGTMRGMESLREVISETEKRFKRLGERSQEISTAVALVNTISERTHVLSLNASMQAATAGEAGRGFAVVAQEVQRLSDSSRQATAEIAKLVSNIQAETNETLITMNRLISDVISQTDLARRAGHEMSQTQSATTELVAMVRQIASFSAQQQELSQALQKNVQGLNEGTAQTSSAIALQTEATDTLVKFAQRLGESVSQFKVGAESSAAPQT